MTRRRAAGALSEPLLATDATAPVPATGSASSGTFSLALNNADSTSGLAAVDNAALVASESFGSSDSKPHTPRAPAQNGAKMADDGDADELTGELIRSSSGQDETNDEDTSDVVDDAFFKSEHLALLHLAAPTAVMYLSRLGMAFTDIAILGSLSTDYLAGAAIGNMWMNLTSTFCDRGVAAAFAVLAGQAYGAGNKRLVGLYAQQALVVAIVLAIPITALWSVAYPALRFLGVGEDEATLAAEFARWSLARPLPLNVYLILQRWLQVQQNTIPAMVINAAFVGVNYGLNILLIHGFSSRGHWYYVPALGFKGSPIATSITQALVTLTLIIYVLISGACADSWPGWRLGRALQPQRFKRYLAQVAPLGLGACFEEWQLETVSLLATRLGKVSVATHNATLSLFVFSSSFMYGIIAAVSVRVARHLGAGAARRARAASRYAVRAALCIGVIVAAVFILGRNAIPRIFSSDPDVWREAAPVQFLAGACYIGMAIFYTNVGTLSGQGRSIIVAGAFLGGAWLVGVPAAWAFANPVKLKLLGLWIGLVFGYVVVTAVTTVFVLRTKWHAVAVRAREQAEVKRAPAFSSGEEGGAAGEDMGSVEGSMDQRGAENSNSLSLRMTPEGTGNEHPGGSTGAPDLDDTV